MTRLWQDVRYGGRMLLRNPGMAAAAVLTLALGIGTNTAIFTAVHATFLDPVPGVMRQEELVELYTIDSGRGIVDLDLSTPEYQDYRDRNDVFTGLLAFGFVVINLSDADASTRIWLLLASENYFDLLGVGAAHGRTFLPDEGVAGGQPVVVISHGLWQRQFGGRADVVGKTITLDGHPFTIVGITPRGFYGTRAGLAFDAWVPLAAQDQLAGWRRSQHRGARVLTAIGRLKPNVSITQAEARLNLVAGDLARAYPATNENLRAGLYPLTRSPRGPAKVLGPTLVALMALVLLLLLITCANVANLLLSRAAFRRREIAIRIALGAGRPRIVRQLLTESLLLAALGGVAGAVFGAWTANLLPKLVPPADIPINFEREVDPGVFLFAMLLTGVTGLLCGLVPALQTTRPNLVASLKDDAAGAVGGPRRSRLQATLVTLQIAFSVILLVTAGLFLRSLLNAQNTNPGFNPRGVLIGTLQLPVSRYTAESGRQFYERLIEKLRALPGVQVPTLVRWAPLGFGLTPTMNIEVEGYTPMAGERAWSRHNHVAPGYFRALEVPLIAGRDLTWQDDETSVRVVVVNQSFAKRYFPERDPLGQRVRFDGTWFTIVGVARDFKTRDLNEPPTPSLYLPVTQLYHPYMTLMLRTTGNPSGFAPSVQRTLREMDVQLPLEIVRTLEQHILGASFPQRVAATFLSAFGALALALAVIGIYGVMAHGVSQRTGEIGIRMALGAQRQDILRLILRRGIWLIFVGLSLGVGGSFAVTRLLGQLLIGVSPRDALTFAGVTVILALVALLACYIPAQRATRVDPVVALRHE